MKNDVLVTPGTSPYTVQNRVFSAKDFPSRMIVLIHSANTVPTTLSDPKERSSIEHFYDML